VAIFHLCKGTLPFAAADRLQGAKIIAFPNDLPARMYPDQHIRHGKSRVVISDLQGDPGHQ
jgi:putative intracellular protease/amidase